MNGIELVGKKINVDHKLEYWRKGKLGELSTKPYLLQQLDGEAPIDRGTNTTYDQKQTNYYDEGNKTPEWKPAHNDTIIVKKEDKQEEETQIKDKERHNEMNIKVKEEHNEIIKKEDPMMNDKKKKKKKKKKKNKKKKKRKYSELLKADRESYASFEEEARNRLKRLKYGEEKKRDVHIYGYATGFQVGHGDDRLERDKREAYEKYHGYGSSIKNDGNLVDKMAYDKRKFYEEQDRQKLEQEKIEKAIERSKRREDYQEQLRRKRYGS
eukprot:CAMPEP_0117428338 /NCGR_PEP_ID=MMETSP0758-20121206/8079_1 /TAXON_ID=63605 /ORGANISM="Percolomonas cosmopolitus, Strain AE-1 (ATCC 50343)" /LENGTH=267 /DNA_ID=CAMNT_0005214661 /DNA_START=277 /DNA_END=1080 /DNA_ORIENTATION=+